MGPEEKKAFDFVLRHYEEGRFDTRKAISAFRNRYGYRRGHAAALSGIAAAAAAVVFVLFMVYRPDPVRMAAVSDKAVFVLPDSSSVTLAPGSYVKFDRKGFRRGRRSVRMEGKAYFSVAHDAEHPFEICTGGEFVRVLGTEFQVDATGPGLTGVSVFRGKVLFSRGPEQPGVILTDGMEAVLKDGSDMPEIQPGIDVNELAWARGVIVFDAAPLDEVLKVLSEAYGVLLSAEPSDKRLTGTFPAGDISEIVSLIEAALGTDISAGTTASRVPEN